MGPRPGASEYKWSAADFSHLFTMQSSSMDRCTVKQKKTSCDFVAYFVILTSNNPPFASQEPTQ
jgi:hypothetical protein